MSLLKLLGIKSQEELDREKREAIFKRFGIERELPPTMQFWLIAYDENGKRVDDWYLGTRCRNEPEGLFFIKAYGLEKVAERIVSQDEAVVLWSRWLNRPPPFSLFASQHACEYSVKWSRWSHGNIVDLIAAKSIGDLPASYTFKVTCSV